MSSVTGRATDGQYQYHCETQAVPVAGDCGFGTASAIGGALYLVDVDMSGNGETVAEQEPVPDMTGVVGYDLDDKVRQHATTEMQVTAAQMQKQYEEIRRELDVLNKQRGDDQRRIEKLGQDNAAPGRAGKKPRGANPVTATGTSLYRRCLPHRPARKANHTARKTPPYPSRRRAALLFHRRRRFIPGMVSRHHHR